MDLLLTTVLCFGIIVGYKAQQSGKVNYACRQDEDYYACRSPCEPTCDSISRGSTVSCSRSCTAGCFCRNGLVRASDKSCVPPDDCFRPNCQENEEFNECGLPCELNCTNFNDGIFCTKPCYKGCFCKAGFVRDANRRCIPPENCYVAGNNQQCGPNQRYVRCVSFCNTCWEFNYCTPSFCQPGCDCIPGFYKNFYGECISANECHSIYGIQRSCEENEEYSSCINNCNDCYYKGRCPYPQYYCERGCDCKRGFFRNDRGVCVPEENCYRQECGEDEVYVECGPSCRTTCDNFRQRIYEPCRRDCVPGCVCRGNRVLGPRGTCINPEFCPGEQRFNCPINESYYDCKPTCRNTCENIQDSTLICDTSCTPGCFCKSGLIRRNDGVCVLQKECPLVQRPNCPVNEIYYVCIPTCRNTCENVNDTNSVCTRTCTPGCFCKGGLVRRNDGACVPQNKCPSVQCPPRQEYYMCLPTCLDTCENYNITNICPQVCIPGCSCPRELMKRRYGICIQLRDCEIATPPVQCPPGQEYYVCLPTCRDTCENYNTTNICPKICISGCSCPRGLVKRRDGICVQPRDCELVCGPNEEFRECGTACPLTCSNWNQNVVCSQRCIKGCFCQRGFIFGPDGLCIRPSSCPRTTPCSTPDTTNFQGRRGGSDDDDSTDDDSVTPLPTKTEMPANITEKTASKTEETTSAESNSTESRVSEATTAISTASQEPDTQSNTTLSEETTAAVSHPQTTKMLEVTKVTTSSTTNVMEDNTPSITKHEESSTPNIKGTEISESSTSSPKVTTVDKTSTSSSKLTTVDKTSTPSPKVTTVDKTSTPSPKVTTADKSSIPSLKVTKTGESPENSTHPVANSEVVPNSTQSVTNSEVVPNSTQSVTKHEGTSSTTVITTITGTENTN